MKVISVESNILWNLLKKANNEGRKGNRLVGMKNFMTSAASDPMNQYVLIYDDGPKSASESIE